MNENKKKLSFKDILILIFSILIIIFQCIIMINQYTHDCNDYKDDVKTHLENHDHINFAYSNNTQTIVNTYDYSYIYFNTSLSSTELSYSLSDLEDVIASFNDVYYAWYNGDDYLKFESLANSQWKITIANNGVERVVYNNGFWNVTSNPMQVGFINGLEEITFEGVEYPVGELNNNLIEVVSSIPFLFQGTQSINYQSSGLNSNSEYIYINNNSTNQLIKNQFDTFGGINFNFTIGINDIDNDTTHSLTFYNSPADAYIKFDNDYLYKYAWFNYTDTWFYGLNPSYIYNNRVFFANEIEYVYPENINYNFINCMISSSNDFVTKSFTYQDILDAYERGQDEGYREGYDVGYTEGELSSNGGYDKGFQEGKDFVINNPNQNGLYTQQQYDDNYWKGYNDVPSNIDENGFKLLVNTILNAPYNIFNGMLNFELFGVNVFNVLSFFVTIALIAIVIKIILGAR